MQGLWCANYYQQAWAAQYFLLPPLPKLIIPIILQAAGVLAALANPSHLLE